MSSLAKDSHKQGFSPFNFQAPLAAGGVTLMAYNWLQFAVPHGNVPAVLSDIDWTSMSSLQTVTYGLLVGIMLLLTIVNLMLTFVFLRDLVRWLAVDRGHREFMDGPVARSTGIFVPIASLAMTMAVVFASAPFFVPAVSANMQALMMPGLIAFLALWITALAVESRLLVRWLSQPLHPQKLNFVWLLDVFAFGLVALAGTGVASMAADRGVASVAATASLLIAGVGALLLTGKLILLVYVQLRSRDLPEHQLQPAFFLLVPISCLYGISFYRMMAYLQKWFELDVSVPSYFLVMLSYGVSAGWAVFTVYLLGDYFRNYFRESEYFPTQWSIV
jgi:hypothetical protein